MDDFNNLISKYTNIISINNIDNYNKIENDIIHDILYNKLDMDEQLVVVDMIKSNIDNINNKVQIVEKPKEHAVYAVEKPKYNKPKFGLAYMNNIDLNEYHPKSSTYNYNKKITIDTSNGNYVNNDSKELSEGALLSSITKALLLEPISEEIYIKRSNQYNFLRNIELPEQRSKAWFDMRNNKITASDCGAVLGENKHEPQFNFVMKKVFGSTFETNLACYHGKKFENVVTLMYEYVNDSIVDEFGLLGHPEHKFLGASPDGICSPFCRDGKTPCQLVGRMLEIKCPLMRKIKYSGEIKGEICPDYYWCQVQLQLECCDLEECDFVQCNIEEYRSRQDFLDDTNPSCDFKSKKYGIERGVVIELVPNKLGETDYTDGKLANETIYDKTSFIYQPKLDMSLQELDNWILLELNKLETKPTVRLHRVIYWRFIERNCTLIKRDKPWFEKNLEKMRTIWSYVEFLRENKEVATEWKTWLDAQSKKYNDKVFNKLIELINKVSPIPFKNLNNLDKVEVVTKLNVITAVNAVNKIEQIIETAELNNIDKLVVNELIIAKDQLILTDNIQVDKKIKVDRKIKVEKVEKVKKVKEVKEVKDIKVSKNKKIVIPIHFDSESDSE